MQSKVFIHPFTVVVRRRSLSFVRRRSSSFVVVRRRRSLSFVVVRSSFVVVVILRSSPTSTHAELGEWGWGTPSFVHSPTHPPTHPLLHFTQSIHHFSLLYAN